MRATGTEVRGHVALALARYLRSSRVDGIVVPVEVRVLAELLARWCEEDQNRDRAGQVAPPLGDHGDLGDAEAMTSPLMTKSEVARAMRCSLRTVSRLIAEGLLPAVKVGGSTRVRRADFDSFVSSRPTTFRDTIEVKASA